MSLSITMLCYYVKCHYAECRILFTIMLNVIMMSVIKLSVVAPQEHLTKPPPHGPGAIFTTLYFLHNIKKGAE
jgi:hypothetical protein